MVVQSFEGSLCNCFQGCLSQFQHPANAMHSSTKKLNSVWKGKAVWCGHQLVAWDQKERMVAVCNQKSDRRWLPAIRRVLAGGTKYKNFRTFDDLVVVTGKLQPCLQYVAECIYSLSHLHWLHFASHFHLLHPCSKLTSRRYNF